MLFRSKKYLPRYKDRIPTPLEYQYMINAIPRTKEAPEVVRMFESIEQLYASDHHDLVVSSSKTNNIKEAEAVLKYTE